MFWSTSVKNHNDRANSSLRLISNIIDILFPGKEIKLFAGLTITFWKSMANAHHGTSNFRNKKDKKSFL